MTPVPENLFRKYETVLRSIRYLRIAVGCPQSYNISHCHLNKREIAFCTLKYNFIRCIKIFLYELLRRISFMCLKLFLLLINLTRKFKLSL
jgi:hypothetical protein